MLMQLTVALKLRFTFITLKWHILFLRVLFHSFQFSLSHLFLFFWSCFPLLLAFSLILLLCFLLTTVDLCVFLWLFIWRIFLLFEVVHLSLTLVLLSLFCSATIFLCVLLRFFKGEVVLLAPTVILLGCFLLTTVGPCILFGLFIVEVILIFDFLLCRVFKTKKVKLSNGKYHAWIYFMISFCVVLYYSTSYVLTYYCISNLVNNVLPFNLIYHIGKCVPNLNRIEHGINVTHEKLVVSLHLHKT